MQQTKNKRLRPKRRAETTDFNEAMNRPKIYPQNLSIEDRKFNEWVEKIKNSPINQNKKLRVKQTVLKPIEKIPVRRKAASFSDC